MKQLDTVELYAVKNCLLILNKKVQICFVNKSSELTLTGILENKIDQSKKPFFKWLSSKLYLLLTCNPCKLLPPDYFRDYKSTLKSNGIHDSNLASYQYDTHMAAEHFAETCSHLPEVLAVPPEPFWDEQILMKRSFQLAQMQASWRKGYQVPYMFSHSEALFPFFPCKDHLKMNTKILQPVYHFTRFFILLSFTAYSEPLQIPGTKAGLQMLGLLIFLKMPEHLEYGTLTSQHTSTICTNLTFIFCANYWTVATTEPKTTNLMPWHIIRE